MTAIPASAPAIDRELEQDAQIVAERDARRELTNMRYEDYVRMKKAEHGWWPLREPLLDYKEVDQRFL